MKRIDTATRLVDAYGAGRDGFTEGTPGVTAPTALNAVWFGNVQEEIARFIELAGLTLDGADKEQLAKALYAFMGVKASSGELVYINGAGAATPKSRVTYFAPGAASLSPLGTNPPQLLGYRAYLRDPSNAILWDLSALLPDGAVVTKVRAHVQLGVIGGTAGSLGINASTYSAYGTFPGASTVASANAADNLTEQILDSGAISQTIGKTAGGSLTAVVKPNSTTTTTNPFNAFSLEVTWTDPGPRNY